MLLRDTPEGTWHRLVRHPDTFTSNGPTAFEVMWSTSITSGKPWVYSRDLGSKVEWRVSGRDRTHAYLNTPVA